MSTSYFFVTARGTKVSVILLILISCDPAMVDDPIPPATFADISIDLDFPDYAALKSDKGFVEITSGKAGVRGIIVYRHSQNSYLAYEKNCSYRPNEACATVYAHTSGLFMIDDCCGSTFGFSDGIPMGGPAWRPLRKYRIRLNNSKLVITDEIQQ